MSGGGRPQTPERNDIPAFLAAWAAYKRDGFRTRPGEPAGTLLPAGTPEPKSWHATLEQIEKAEWTLSASRYKPQVAAAASNEDPKKLITSALDAEVEITDGLKKLLHELSR